MARTNKKGEFDINIEEGTNFLLEISINNYETITVNPFKGDGSLKDNLGVIFLDSTEKSNRKEIQKNSVYTKTQIDALNFGKKDFQYYAMERLRKEAQNLKTKAIPFVLNIIKEFGITKSTELIEKSNDDIQQAINDSKCVPPDQLLELIKKRNKLVKKINITLKIVDSTLIALGVTGGILLTIKTAKNATVLIPFPLPPIIIETIKTLDKKISRFEFGIDILTIIIELIKEILLLLLNLLSLTDQLIQNCSPNTVDFQERVSIELNDLTQEQSNEQGSPIIAEINGFIMGIETEITTNSLKRKRAIAKNKQGVIMLKGEYSFSSIEQILIDEFIFYIQQNDLKAD
jgi:hypothetical protein